MDTGLSDVTTDFVGRIKPGVSYGVCPTPCFWEAPMETPWNEKECNHPLHSKKNTLTPPILTNRTHVFPIKHLITLMPGTITPPHSFVI